jgi:hypothetical protein
MPLQLRTARQSRHEPLVAEWSLWSCHFGPFAHCLQQPPKQAVLNVGWTPNGTVSLTFEDNDLLEIYDDSANYESYTISSPAGLIVV